MASISPFSLSDLIDCLHDALMCPTAGGTATGQFLAKLAASGVTVSAGPIGKNGQPSLVFEKGGVRANLEADLKAVLERHAKIMEQRTAASVGQQQVPRQRG